MKKEINVAFKTLLLSGVLVLAACGGSDTSTATLAASSSAANMLNPVATGMLNDTGITDFGSDEYGNYVRSCADAAPGDDCNTGRDGTANDDSDGRAGFSFTKIAADGSALPASSTSWSCVKDNVTGLIWENKTAANASLTYTHYENPTAFTQEQINAPTNSVGYKNAANAAKLCGADDWLIPTASEFASIVDYGAALDSASIDNNWFPNTQQRDYWVAAETYQESINLAKKAINFAGSYRSVAGRVGASVNLKEAIRLVRATRAPEGNRYQISADEQEVTDVPNGLIWRRCEEGLRWNGSACAGSVVYFPRQGDALKFASSIAATSGQAWRLLNVQERQSTWGRSGIDPKLGVAIFPAEQGGMTWISTRLREGIDSSTEYQRVSIRLVRNAPRSASSSNVAPVAKAGSDQHTSVGATVILNGGASTDVNGDTLTYVWTLASKPAGSVASLSNSGARRPDFIADKAGSYVLTLVVNDGKINSSNLASVIVTALAVGASGSTGKLNDTGVTIFGYSAADNYANLWSCASSAVGNDCNTGRDITGGGFSVAGFSYIKIAADGSVLPDSAPDWRCVKDNVTGLIWEVKTPANGSIVYTNYDSTNSPQYSTQTYYTSLNGANYSTVTQAQIDAGSNSIGYKNAMNAASLCGASDWRLPTDRELIGIVDYSVASPGPTIATNWFRDTLQSDYWSSAPAVVGNNSRYQGIDSYYYDEYAFVVGFGTGASSISTRKSSAGVRLVRADPLVAMNHYRISTDGQEATDVRTGLIWRRCVEGASWNGSACAGDAVEYSHIGALQRANSEATASGKAWRLPNVKELESLVERSRVDSPRIDLTVFPDVYGVTWFWSSTPEISNAIKNNERLPDYAWGVDFSTGSVEKNERFYYQCCHYITPYHHLVRLVRTAP